MNEPISLRALREIYRNTDEVLALVEAVEAARAYIDSLPGDQLVANKEQVSLIAALSRFEADQ